MKLMGVWLAIVLVSLVFFYVGMLEGSKITLFIGALGIASGILCELSNLIVWIIKRK